MKNAFCPATALYGSLALSFVIPSAAEGSAVPRTFHGNVFSTERTRISCCAAPEMATCAAFFKESRMKGADPTKTRQEIPGGRSGGICGFSSSCRGGHVLSNANGPKYESGSNGNVDDYLAGRNNEWANDLASSLLVRHEPSPVSGTDPWGRYPTGSLRLTSRRQTMA